MAVQEGSGAREKGEDEATPVSCLGVAAASFLRLQVCMSLSHPDLTCLRGSQELHLPQGVSLAAPTHHSSQRVLVAICLPREILIPLSTRTPSLAFL